MAKVLPNYSLCPLIEQKSFVGMTEDAENDCIIVTVNGNIISRYTVSSAKQIGSWNTKGYITCPVTYDRSRSEYAAIFNRNELRLWPLETENIDKVPKYKFAGDVHAVLKLPIEHREKTVLVFKRGLVDDVDEAIANRKNPISVGKSDSFEDDEYVRNVETASLNDVALICLLTEKRNEAYRLHFIPWRNNSSADDCDGNRRFALNLTLGSNGNGNAERDNAATYISHCLVVTDNNRTCCSLLTLWSDGKLFITKLLFSSTTAAVDFPGRFLTGVSIINTSQPVLMRPLSANDVAIYGHNNEGEGSLLMCNIKYSLVRRVARYKRHAVTGYLWSLGWNLFLLIGHNLVVKPYTLKNQKLSSLVGTYNNNHISSVNNNCNNDNSNINNDNSDVNNDNSNVNNDNSDVDNDDSNGNNDNSDIINDISDNSNVNNDNSNVINDDSNVNNDNSNVNNTRRRNGKRRASNGRDGAMITLQPECKTNEILISRLLEANDVFGLLHAVKNCVDLSDDLVISVLSVCLSNVTLYGDVLRTVLYRHYITDVAKLQTISLQSSLLLIDQLIDCFPSTVENQMRLLRWMSSTIDVLYQRYFLDCAREIVDKLNALSDFLETETKRLDDYKELLALSSVIRRRRVIFSKPSPI